MGVAKAGTTWLWQTLVRSGVLVPGVVKEFHHLDTLYVPIPKRGGERECEGPFQTDGKSTAEVLREKFRTSPEYYFEYFDQLMDDRNASMAGDFTPLHSGIPESGLRAIVNAFGRRHIDVLPIVILRDPVTRLNSQARHALARSQKDWTPAMELDAMHGQLCSRLEQHRSGYDRILRRLHASFESFPVLLYEELLRNQDEFLRGVESQLELPLGRLKPCPPVNVGHPTQIGKRELSRFRRYYEDQYAAAEAYFGGDQIADLWEYL